MHHSENHDHQHDGKKSTCGAWLWPFILVLTGAIVMALVLRSCNLKAGDGMLALTAQNKSHEGGEGHEGEHGASTEAHQESGHEGDTHAAESKGHLDANGNFQYDLGNTMQIILADGTTLKVGENSTEAKLYSFLNDKNTALSEEGNWFDFTNVNFKSGSDQVTEDSNTQLKNLVAIIKNFPTAKFKIGGYTDNSGDAKANLALSQKRADQVAKLLVSMGVNKDAIAGAEGYGPEHPVASNDTPEGKAQNRRVSVNVKAK